MPAENRELSERGVALTTLSSDNVRDDQPVRCALATIAVLCSAGLAACSTAGQDDRGCRIPDPAVGDRGIAQVRTHAAGSGAIVASFGGRQWSTSNASEKNLPASVDAVVVKPRRTKGAQRSRYPRLLLRAKSGDVVLRLRVIGCG